MEIRREAIQMDGTRGDRKTNFQRKDRRLVIWRHVLGGHDIRERTVR